MPESLTLGHSPDPDDAFMFHALAAGKVDAEGIEFQHILQDIETLNRRAGQSELDVTALSAHAYAFLADRYALMPCGASMGDGYGPMVVARQPGTTLDDLRGQTIAVPGQRTTAFLTLRLCMGDFQYREVAFDRIPEAVITGEADAGLLIHEGQLTYAEQGLHLVVDLGVWWKEETGGLPLPLGVNAVRSDLPVEIQRRAVRAVKRSIAWGLAHRSEALLGAGAWGRGLDAMRTDRFVAMYVNELTIDMGPRGRRALEELYRRGIEKDYLPIDAQAIFVSEK